MLGHLTSIDSSDKESPDYDYSQLLSPPNAEKDDSYRDSDKSHSETDSETDSDSEFDPAGHFVARIQNHGENPNHEVVVMVQQRCWC